MQTIRRFNSGGIAVALTAAIALASGCGGGSDTTETASQAESSSSSSQTQATKVVLKPQAPLTKEQFIQRADANCAKSYEERGNALFKYTRRAASLSESEKEQVVSKVVIPSFRRDLEALEAFAKHSAPKGDEAKLEALLEAYAAELAEAEENPALVLASAPEQFAETTKLAREYGFQSCGSF